MSEHNEFPISREDTALDRYLRALPRFAPTSGFGDRVLARVRAPLSVRLRRAWSRVGALATPGRLWWTSGLMAASSTAWVVAAASWLSGARLGAAGAWLLARFGQPAWSGTLQAVATASQGMGHYALAAYTAFGTSLFLAGLPL